MTEEMVRREVERSLGTERTCITTVALYSTQPDEPAREEPIPRLAHETLAATCMLPPGLYRELVGSARDQLPRVARVSANVTISPLPEPSLIDIASASLMLFALPSGGHLIALWLRYTLRDAPPVRPLPELYEVIDGGRWGLTIDGRPLLAAAVEGATLPAAGLRLGPDFHGITFLPPGAWPPRSEIDRDLAMRLVSRRNEPSRPDFLTARLPPEANRYKHMLTAVTPGASAIAGHGEAANVALLLSAVQAIASLSSLRQLQRRAFDHLQARDHAAARPDVADEEQALLALERDATELRALQLDLSFSVETFLDMRLLIPSLPVQQYHRELTEALALSDGARVTAAMLARLDASLRAGSESLAARRDRRLAADRETEERRRDIVQVASAALAGIAVPLTLSLGFLGINVEPVRSGTDVLSSRYIGWYVGFVLFPLIVIAVAVHAIRRGRR